MYYKLGQACATNWGGFVLLQIRGNVITNWGRFIITNWDKALFCITTGFVKKYYIVVAVLMVTHLTLFIVGIITQLNTNVTKPLAVLLIS